MPKVNEPQRVITRGRTRTIGEPRRPHEPSGTVKERGADRPVTGAPRSLASRASSEQGTSRAVQEPPRAPRTVSDERRPLDRIADLEAKLERLELVVFGNGEPVPEDQSPPLVQAVADVEAVIAQLAETTGHLVEQVGSMGDEEHAPSGIMKVVADLGDRMAAVGPPFDPEVHRDTEPPSSVPPVLTENAG